MYIEPINEEISVYRVIIKRSRSKKDMKKGLWRIEFYAYSLQEPHTGILELKIKTQADLVIGYARELNFKEIKTRRKKSILFETTDWEKYAKLLLYTAIVSTIRKKYKKLFIRDSINTLGFFDIKYWTGLIISYYKEMKYKGILRPIKALKVLLKIDK